MSPISSIGSVSAHVSPVATASPRPQKAVAPAAPSVTPTTTKGTYRNKDGDIVSLSGIVVVDHDGDGGVGQPVTKAKPEVHP